MARKYASKFAESESISSRLRQMIKERGITQREFCVQTGISVGHLSKVLTGNAIPSGNMLICIANKGYDVNLILTGTSSESKLEERETEIEKLGLIIEELRSIINFNLKK